MAKDAPHRSSLKIGVSGLGRIGKLTVWHHTGRKYFDELVVNIGREEGHATEAKKDVESNLQPENERDRASVLNSTIVLGTICLILIFCFLWGSITKDWEPLTNANIMGLPFILGHLTSKWTG